MPHYAQQRIAGAMNTTHIYYNINVTDDNTGFLLDSTGTVKQQTTNDKEIPLVFNQSRSQPYLRNPSEYFLTVTRFTIESPNLPTYIVQPIVGNNTDVNKLVYTVSLYSPSTQKAYKQSVIWVPEDLTAQVPKLPITQNTISPSSNYYYGYSYNHFINCVNTAFKNLIANNIDLAGVPAPYLYFDALTNLFTIGGQANYFATDGKGGDAVYSIFFNTELFNLFSSLPYVYDLGKLSVVNTDNTQLDYQIILNNNGYLGFATNEVTNPLTGLVDVISTQEYSTLPLWSPVTSIIFKTSMLHTAPEQLGTPNVYQYGLENVNAKEQNADILNIMIDHIVPLTSGTEYKPYIFYEPQGEYKLTDLYGVTPVDTIDISCFWQDTFGNLIPFYLGVGCSATIKVLFRKKDFNSVTL
jgi:hypothetical protein